MLTIIDGDSLIYLSLPKKNQENVTYEYCIAEMTNRINDILVKTNATKYIICLTEGKCFRYKDWKYATDYKANRKNKDNKSNVPPIFYAMKEHLKQNFNSYWVKELEADDLVSIIAYECKEPYTVCSIDKDVIGQIPGIHFNYRNQVFIETKEEEIQYNTWKQVLTGDLIDGIYGIRGIGESTAKKLFNNRQDYYHVVLEQYVKVYGIYEGINRFYENYSLIYLLKSFDEVKREVAIDMKMPKFKEIGESEQSDWEEKNKEQIF